MVVQLAATFFSSMKPLYHGRIFLVVISLFSEQRAPFQPPITPNKRSQRLWLIPTSRWVWQKEFFLAGGLGPQFRRGQPETVSSMPSATRGI